MDRDASAGQRLGKGRRSEERARSGEAVAGSDATAPSQVGDPDGHGQYGVLDEDEDGLLCHTCGRRVSHLGLHAHRAHGMTATQYRMEHGLRRSKGLVAAAVHEKLVERSAAQLARRPAFVASRDTRKATAARLAANQPPSPAGAAASAAAASRRGGSRRAGIVVVCAECAAEFCPLQGASKRRFCSRSCASRHNRRLASRSTRELRSDVETTPGTDGRPDSGGSA